jgi:NADH dehydrogenase FAD-containing subunit
MQIPYDILSIANGSTVTLPEALSAAVPVKPLSNLANIHEQLLQTPQRKQHVAVIGGGASGCEIAANIVLFCQKHALSCTVTVYTKHGQLLMSLSSRARKAATKILLKLGVQIQTEAPIAQARNKTVTTESGETFPADITIAAVGLKPHPLCQQAGFACSSNGELLVNTYLQSTSHPMVFGGGDAVQFTPKPLPKLGVYGIRQGPILMKNLRATVTGAALKPYSPQSRYLLILNLGSTGLATWARWYWSSCLALCWKDWIDQRFMRRYKVVL